MFRSIGREIRHLPNHVVALFVAAPVLIYLDAGHVVSHPIYPGFTHLALVGLTALCLMFLYADGSAPAGPWERGRSERRHDALRMAVLLLTAVMLCAVALQLLQPLLPPTHVETWSNGQGSHGSLSYPEIDGVVDLAVVAATICMGVAAFALIVLAICAPACAALHGIRRGLPEAWRAWRRCYFRLFGLCVIAMLALLPSMALFSPLQAYWDAGGFFGAPDSLRLQLAVDICNRIGPHNIALGAGAATFLVGVIAWAFARAVARLIGQPRG